MAVDQSTLDAALGTNVQTDTAADRAKLAALTKQSDDVGPKLATASADVAKLESQTAADEQPLRQKIANQTPRESALPTPKAPDFTSNEPSPQQFQQTAGMLMVMAGLVGAVTRGGYTGALNNMTAALQGFQAGDAEAAKKNLDEYKTHVDEFKTKLAALKEDRDELDKMDQHDIAGLNRQLEFIAHKNDSPLLAAKAQVAAYTDARKELDRQIEHTEKTITASENLWVRMDDVRERHQDREAARQAANGADASSGLTPAGQAAEEELARAGRPIPKTKRGQVDTDLLNRLGDHEAGGAGSGGVSGAQADYKADSASLALQQKRADAIDGGMRKIDADIKTIDSTIGNGNIDFGPWLSKPLNAMRTGAGSADLAAYALSVKQVATEYERLLQGGQLSTAQLHQGAADDASKILNENMTVEQVRRVIPVMLREMNNARAATHDQISDIRTRMHAAPPRPAAASSAAQPFGDVEKERRYQSWKAEHGGAQ